MQQSDDVLLKEQFHLVSFMLKISIKATCVSSSKVTSNQLVQSGENTRLLTRIPVTCQRSSQHFSACEHTR